MAIDKPTRICSIDGCRRTGPLRRGWCNGHYLRWLRHGTPLGGGANAHPTPEESFESRTEWREGCLIWTGVQDRYGYGKIKIEKKMVKAHRYAWERVHGPIPDGMLIDHTCHTPACVNVEHLRIATHSENSWNRSGPENGKVGGVRNVYRHREKWRVTMMKDGKVHRFGTYSSLEEATKVANRAREALFGEFAGEG